MKRSRRIIVFGIGGRFGSSIAALRMQQGGKVLGLRSDQLAVGANCILDLDISYRGVEIFWCLGKGSSGANSPALKERRLLETFFELIANKGIIRTELTFNYLSSGGKLYGINPGEVSEESRLDAVGSYGREKIACERLIWNASQSLNFKVTTFRIANAYTLRTSNTHPQGLIESAIWSIEHNTPLLLKSSLTSRRQYASHLDYSRAILKFADALEDAQRISTCHLAPEFDYSIGEIVNLIERHFNRKLNLNFGKASNMMADSLFLKSNNRVVNDLHINWKRLEENLAMYL